MPAVDEEPASAAALFRRMEADRFIPFAIEGELIEVVESLVADGLAAGDGGRPERWRLSAEGADRLQGPIANEPPPLEGKALEDAQAADVALHEEEREVIATAKAERVTRLKTELKEAEAEAAEPIEVEVEAEPKPAEDAGPEEAKADA